MAIKDRISGLFRRGKKTAPLIEGPATDQATPQVASRATEEERNEILRQLGDGFSGIAGTIERLDEHLDAGTRSVEGMLQTQNRLPGLLEEQRTLIEQTNKVAEQSQAALETLNQHLSERDQIQADLVTRLEDVAAGLRTLREHDRSQVDLLMQFQRSGRRMAMVIGLLGLLVIAALMVLLLIVALRPDFLGLNRTAQSESTRLPLPPAHDRVESPTPPSAAPALEPQAELDDAADGLP